MQQNDFEYNEIIKNPVMAIKAMAAFGSDSLIQKRPEVQVAGLEIF